MLEQSFSLPAESHCCDDLITIFNRLFAAQQNTVLEKGADEPLYKPATEAGEQHRVLFRHDYFASALHEVAHWCIASAARRVEIDYGYWYAPDGRTAQQQCKFEQAEIKPQALEWIFAQAAGCDFRVSNDNLAAGETTSHAFEMAVHRQVLRYCQRGVPPRAECFRRALAEFYKTSINLHAVSFGSPQCA